MPALRRLAVVWLHQADRPIQQGFELSGKTKIIQGKARNQHVCPAELSDKSREIVRDRAGGAAAPAGHAAPAGLDAVFCQRKRLKRPACTLQKGAGKPQRIAGSAARAAIEQQSLHVDLLLCSVRLKKLPL